MDSSSMLISALTRHLANPEFIKGWEVDKRTCNGAKRQALRKAAREAKALSSRSRSGQPYLKAIEKLRVELEAASEADFDGLLGEALTGL
eukprot:1240575-Prymnesium_polylepis.1